MMDKYINREELVEWLKRIPLKDLSDGLGLCRVIMEEDFKRAIRTIPDGAIVDLEPVVRCKDCLLWKSGENDCESWEWCKMLHREMPPNAFCNLCVRKDDDDAKTD